MIIVKWYVKLAFNVVFVMFLNKHINSLPSHHPQKHLHHYFCILLLPPFRVSRSGLRPKPSRFLAFSCSAFLDAKYSFPFEARFTSTFRFYPSHSLTIPHFHWNRFRSQTLLCTSNRVEHNKSISFRPFRDTIITKIKFINLSLQLMEF